MMASSNHPVLEYFFEVYRDNPSLHQLEKTLKQQASPHSTADSISEITEIYETAIPIINKQIWSTEPNELSIKKYQQLFQEMESLIAARDNDRRHKFIVVIPVADRPRHLHSCLQSLLTLCQSFHYGGYINHKYPAVAVIIADDSKEQDNIRKHKGLAHHFNLQGIETIYFGQDEQWEQLERLPQRDKKRLVNIVGDFDKSSLYHKGPSIMRNITYLKLNEMRKEKSNLLFHFVDSDQEYQIKIQSGGEDKAVYAINYFYELDKIFSKNDICILTGKVVGDPPVSPSVMAGTFLDDVITFLHRIAAIEPALPCQFHKQHQQKEYDAAYHDMAELFGFKPASEAYHYRCHLVGKHDHYECFANFSGKLNQFFHGEHPTRKSYFNHEEPVSAINPARTIYTGNYIFNTEGLNYFIPFARLRLRMAGPVLGRIIKSESKDRFVSANLPMLHNRTVEDTGKSEFRPGINSERDKIDLSGEFERQFFGDVMLFSMEQLTAMGYPENPIDKQRIIQLLESTEHDIREKYTVKRNQILEKLNLLKSIFFDNDAWWNTSNSMESAKEDFTKFLDNIEKNFGSASPCYELIDSDVNRNNHFKAMLDAIIEYPSDKQAWSSIIESRVTT